MEKIKITEESATEKEKSKIEHFNNYKNHPMVRIKGNFYGGGFNLSKNKIIAVIENIDMLKEFANGKYDKQILELNDDEILKI